MTLHDLVLAAFGRPSVHPWAERFRGVEVRGVAQDSARVEPGFVFVARPGAAVDGHRYVRLAIDRGAVAVIGEKRDLTVLPWRRVPYLHVEDAKAAIPRLAAALHGRPAEALVNLGVTGTDGKTTTAFLLHHLLGAAHPSGLLSTAAVRVGAEELVLEGHFTTPEAPEVQAVLARFRDAGLRFAVIEASSHGFAQHRLDEITFEVGVWTNLSPEHLDFHGSFDAYRDAKLTLVRRSERAVLNRDDAAFSAFAAASRRVIGYGLHPDAEWRADALEERPGRIAFTLRSAAAGAARAELPMVGAYNVHNALAALAAAHAVGVPLREALARLGAFAGVPGRMQVVQAEPFAVVVDFAHTAPALDKALGAVRPARGRLIVVVGAAGERDPGKRRPIGRVAVRAADLAVFTEEDSRSEDTDAILAEIAAGAIEAGGRQGEDYRLLADRREAIAYAIDRARPGDVVLLAGKGHEASLERRDETLAWDEVAEARRHLG